MPMLPFIGMKPSCFRMESILQLESRDVSLIIPCFSQQICKRGFTGYLFGTTQNTLLIKTLT